MEEADNGAELSAILFEIECGLPKKLDERQFLIKSEKKCSGLLDKMELLCEFVEEDFRKFCDFIRCAGTLLTCDTELLVVMTLHCNGLILFKELEDFPEFVDISEKSQSLSFEMQSGKNKCEIIMNTFVYYREQINQRGER